MKRILFCLFALLPLTALMAQKKQPVLGTWVTNVASDALLSPENVKATVAECKRHGLNTIYVVVWNKGLTMYPSAVVERYIGTRQDPVYKGFDPIKAIVEEGHKAGMKVYAWFEYGFAYDYRDTNSVWRNRYPHWAGRDNKGALLQKNGFYWWNALHPEVQAFMTELVLEVVKNYDVDGVQGDDRLPAMPAEGGYDSFTLDLYAGEHGGAQPPRNTSDSAWVQWRSNKLSSYIKGLYRQIKREDKHCIVSWAPSIYPWSKEQYLQDWPAWLNGGYADEILPQLYRYNIEAYEKILIELNGQVSKKQKKKVFPGTLIGLGDGYLVKEEMLRQMIALNRKYGFRGECHFYFEGLKKLAPLYRK